MTPTPSQPDRHRRPVVVLVDQRQRDERPETEQHQVQRPAGPVGLQGERAQTPEEQQRGDDRHEQRPDQGMSQHPHRTTGHDTQGHGVVRGRPAEQGQRLADEHDDRDDQQEQ